MIDLKEIDETILKIKCEGTSVKDAERLAVLYDLRAHMVNESSAQSARELFVPAYSMAAKPESEFRSACSGLSLDKLVDSLEDTFQGLKIVAPKAYAAAIRKMKSMKES